MEVSCRSCSLIPIQKFLLFEMKIVAEGVNEDIRYSDIVETFEDTCELCFEFRGFDFFCPSSRDPGDYTRFIPLKCHRVP